MVYAKTLPLFGKRWCTILSILDIEIESKSKHFIVLFWIFWRFTAKLSFSRIIFKEILVNLGVWVYMVELFDACRLYRSGSGGSDPLWKYHRIEIYSKRCLLNWADLTRLIHHWWCADSAVSASLMSLKSESVLI